jgi:hypothetical protein
MSTKILPCVWKIKNWFINIDIGIDTNFGINIGFGINTNFCMPISFCINYDLRKDFGSGKVMVPIVNKSSSVTNSMSSSSSVTSLTKL